MVKNKKCPECSTKMVVCKSEYECEECGYSETREFTKKEIIDQWQEELVKIAGKKDLGISFDDELEHLTFVWPSGMNMECYFGYVDVVEENDEPCDVPTTIHSALNVTIGMNEIPTSYYEDGILHIEGTPADPDAPYKHVVSLNLELGYNPCWCGDDGMLAFEEIVELVAKELKETEEWNLKEKG